MTHRPDRARRLSAFLAVVLTSTGLTGLGLLTAPPAAAETTGPAIVHVPVTTAAYGQPIPISITTTCATGAVCSARLYYRSTAPAALAAVPGIISEGGFQVLGMDPGAVNTANGTEAREWSQTIPGGAVTTTGVDYFVEADHNGTLTRFPGTPTASTVQPVASYQHVHVVTPPLVNHVPVPFAVADQPYRVQAEVSCSTGNCSGTLYYRRTPLNTSDPAVAWSSTGMSAGAGTAIGASATISTFTADVPASFVHTTGVDYYIRITDGHVQAFSPGTPYQGYYAPRDGTNVSFYHAHVLEPPRVVHAPAVTAPYRQSIPITAKTNCPSTRTCAATLYYRTTPPGVMGAAAFASTSMSVTRTVGTSGIDAVSVDGAVPAAAVDTRGVDYFFSVSDGTTTSWFPGTSAVDAPGTWVNGVQVAYQHVHVQEPPHLVHVPPTIAPALEDLVIETELTCATENCSVNLVYTSTPAVANTSVTVPMTRTTAVPSTSGPRVEVRRAVIPASQVTTRGLAYYMTATDGYTNTAAPGTSYWGAYAAVDGSNPAPETARFVVRVVDPPHPLHAPVGVAFTGEPIAIEARSNCATPSCTATLNWRMAGGSWQATTMARSSIAAAYGNDLNTYNATIAGGNVTAAGIEYRIDITDGYVTESTPTYPVVVTSRPAVGGMGTAVAFVPPVAQGPLNSSVALTVKATWADGTPFSGPVRWCASPLASASTGCLASGTATSTNGDAAFTVQPTTADPQLRVLAYADALTVGVQDATEVTGAAVAAGIATPSASSATTVAFVPPVAQTTQGSSTTLSFTARKGDGGTFTGTVRWTTGAPGMPSGSGSMSTSSGNGSVTVTPTASTPVVQVVAWADSPSDGTGGVQDPSELSGTGVAVGTPVPSVPQPTAVVFTDPVATTAQGTSVSVDFTAVRGDGGAFSGTIRYTIGLPTQPLSGGAFSTSGSGSISVTPTSATPVVQVTAYADGPGGQWGAQDAHEVLGSALVAGTPPVGPLPAGTAVVFKQPVVPTTQGNTARLEFIAVKSDGSPFVGAIRWAPVLVGSLPSFTGTTSTDSQGNGHIDVTPTASSPVASVLAYADSAGAGLGVQDPTEATGAGAAVGAPSGAGGVTTVVFDVPVSRGPVGAQQSVWFTAFDGDGSPFTGTVYWGSDPSYGSAVSTEADGRAHIDVTPTAATPVVQILAYADAAGSGGGSQGPTEAAGAAAAIGI